MTTEQLILSELKAVRAELKRLAEREAQGQGAVAVKRADAAKMMGISRRKLEQLIAAGKVRTTENDAHLVPVAEVKRYCAPKAPRGRGTGRKPTIVVNTTSPEAVEAMRRDLRRRRAAP